MSFRGRGSGRGGGGGRGNFGGRGRGGRGGYQGGGYDSGPPERVIEVGHFTHSCAEDLVLKATQESVPYFNAPIYLENKQQIGKVDEIFGPIKDYYLSVKLSDNMKASSFTKNTKLFIDPMKMLPLARFLPRPPGEKGVKTPGRGRGGGPRGGFRGGSGRGNRGFRGGGGGSGGGYSRGGFNRGGGGGFRGRGSRN